MMLTTFLENITDAPEIVFTAPKTPPPRLPFDPLAGAGDPLVPKPWLGSEGLFL
jgi:hypothetical protein